MQLFLHISTFLAFGKRILDNFSTTNVFLAASLSSAKSIPAASLADELANESSRAEVTKLLKFCIFRN
jgi:hypothetical protein